jgi:diguanylate cyclase (GGDEF)-like protein
MARPAPVALPKRSVGLLLGVFALGMVIAAVSTYGVASSNTQMSGLELLSVPLILVIAKFPIVLDRGDGGIEVGFDSAVLMFLLCALDNPNEALVLWFFGVVATQITADKRALYKCFNIGIGMIGAGVSAAVLTGIRGSNGSGTLRELAAVGVAAACYFVCDFVLTAIAVTLQGGGSLREQILQRGTLVAIACFVPFDLLGYLGAVVFRDSAWWTLILLGVPLAVLLVATRAVTRGSENARRLAVLFDAAVRAQTLSDPRQVVDALIDDARRLLRMDRVEIRATPPGPHEIGAQLRDGQRDRWLVAPGAHRARSTAAADRQALEALVAVASDAFARLRLTEDMTHLARHDLLTNLPNRGLLLDRVEHALQLSRRRGTRVALLFIDLDGFKPVNDRFGHAAGDAVLIDVAQRLCGCVRQSDTVARLGGDEFAVLLEEIRPEEVDSACERILSALARGAHVAGHQLALSASIGVVFGDHGETSESMLRNADLAMYEAKSRGKNQFVHYERAIGRSRLQRLELVESLRSSIAANELTLVYQPVVRASTGRITGVEALARWRSNGVDIPPDVFIRVAEESGLVVALGDVVLERATQDAALLGELVGSDLNVAVNISAKQLREPEFVAKVQDARSRTGTTNLILEITERDCVDNDDVTLDAMRRLADAGIHFAIDDFGVGFSSIGYLQDMPVSIIKADASFSESIDTDERSCALLCSITMMGQALGLDVVIEGIERTGQLDHLNDHVHAQYAQGYLLHRPMPLEALVPVLQQNRGLTERDPEVAPAG